MKESLGRNEPQEQNTNENLSPLTSYTEKEVVAVYHMVSLWEALTYKLLS